MAFQAPRIIGGGQIIVPQQQGNPFQGITDEMDKKRQYGEDVKNRELKETALKLEASKEYARLGGLSNPKSPNHIPFEEWYSASNETETPGILDKIKAKISNNESSYDTDYTEGVSEESNYPTESPYLGPYLPKEEASPYQSGGQVSSGYSLVGGGDLPGNRTGDKNRAMLEDGEYVLNRNAVKAIGKGYLDYINDERYPRFQSGGFNDPGVAGGQAQIIKPKAMDNSQAFDFMKKKVEGSDSSMDYSSLAGSGMDAAGYDALVAERQAGYTEGDDDWQEGGYIPHDTSFGWQRTDEYQRGGPVKRRTGYQFGGYYPSTRQGMITNEELEQEQRNRNWESSINKMGLTYDDDVQDYEKSMDEWQREQEKGPMSWARHIGDVLTPEGPMNSLLSYATGLDVTGGLSGLPAAAADDYIRDYRESHMADAFKASNVPEDVRMGEAEYQLLKTRGGTPIADTDARLSTDALKKKWYENVISDDEGFNASDWINQWYGGGGR